MNCPNCNSSTPVICADVSVTSQHVKTSLLHCEACDFLYLDQPTWLEHAYKLSFYSDTGYVQRNLIAAKFLRSFFSLSYLLNPSTSSLEGCDLGTGLGMLPRLMRDHGFHFYGQDEYSRMELIQPFVKSSKDTQVVTAFEVVEHVMSLPDFLDKHLSSQSEIFFFSTLFRSESVIPPLSWWYYAFEVGQHISFHSKRSFRCALAKTSLKPLQLTSFDGGIHAVAFTPKWARLLTFYKRLRKLRLHYLTDEVIYRLTRRESLVEQDHREAIAQVDAISRD